MRCINCQPRSLGFQMPVYEFKVFNKCDPSQQNRAVVCYQEKCDIPLSERAFYYLKDDTTHM